MTRREHRRVSEAIDAGVDAELDDDTARRVAAHAHDCWDCSAAAETARLLKRSLRQSRDREPPRLATARLHRFAERLTPT